MNSDEPVRIQFLLQGLERPPGEKRPPAHVEPDVVGLRLDPIDLLRLQNDRFVTVLDGDPLEGSPPARHLSQQLGQARGELPGFGALEVRAYLQHRFADPLLVERLQQVIEGMELEGPQRELVVSGDEDDRR